jgi:hypothetical protein
MGTYEQDSTLDIVLRDALLALQAAAADPETLGFVVLVLAGTGGGTQVNSTGGWRAGVDRRAGMILCASALRHAARGVGGSDPVD